MNAPHVLDRIVARCRELHGQGKHPVAVLDLDHTLFDNGPRTREILLEFAKSTGRGELHARLTQMRTTGLPYLLRETLAIVDERDDAVVAEATAFWRERFFTDDWIRHDVPLPGAREYCLELYEAGATLAYLSGRDSPNMLVGTAASLRAHGFPIGLAHTALILKPVFEMADFDFKRDVIEFVSELGEVVGTFENEPANANLFRRTWPHAQTILLETACAPNPPPLLDGVAVLRDFTRAP
jgi:hypothetical protein